jgi:hypothetical protein
LIVNLLTYSAKNIITLILPWVLININIVAIFSLE